MEMHRPSISEMEAGRRKVTADELGALAKHYGVSIGWLACEDNDSPNEDDDRIQLAARELSKLKKQDFDKVIGLLTAMKGRRSK